jgi:hypothetical protein
MLPSVAEKISLATTRGLATEEASVMVVGTKNRVSLVSATRASRLQKESKYQYREVSAAMQMRRMRCMMCIHWNSGFSAEGMNGYRGLRSWRR